MRATYHRYHGVMHMIAALDLATGELYYRIRKRWREYLSFLKTLCARWPGEKLYVITDKYSPHKHPQVRSWAADNDVELVFLPTYGSWLKPAPALAWHQVQRAELIDADHPPVGGPVIV
ncbi:transposase [Nonomuraea sp. NPDC005983]|uniref:transposase n=1 Tax=Nonomuraea sp. NPDC005983 TaxID=3155595 RepID=UPI0033B3A1DC